MLVSKHIITTMVIYYRKCGYYGIQDFVKIEEDITAIENSFENSWIQYMYITKETLYQINIKKLNKVSSTKCLSYIYQLVSLYKTITNLL